MRLIPEYEPVQTLMLSFVHDFFNTRFHYGEVHCAMIAAVSRFVDVEVYIHRPDLAHWQVETARAALPGGSYSLNFDSPRRAIVLEYVPIFAETDDGQPIGLVFRIPLLEHPAFLKRFARRMVRRLDLPVTDLGFDFASACLSVSDDLVLLAEAWFQGRDADAKLEYFRSHYPGQSFHIVPTLAGEVTNDLDMFLWPIRPRVWICSEYPSGSAQARSMEPALEVLRAHGHTVHRVPGLEPIIYDDVNTMPNYVNGVILNQAALIPAYGRKEDGVVQGILKDYGFEVLPIDCRQVILSNSGLHCISKAIPRLPRKKVN